MFFNFSDWDSFEQKCLSLLNQCTTEELKEMNSWLRYATPAWKLEKARDPYELFTQMVNAELLSPDNLYFLARLLPFVDREDLKGELLKDQQFEGKRMVLKTAFCLGRTAICVPGS